eukprot:7691304-Alexandrium_andersonii.AAC.1
MPTRFGYHPPRAPHPACIRLSLNTTQTSVQPNATSHRLELEVPSRACDSRRRAARNLRVWRAS